MRIRDHGSEIEKNRIRNKQPGSATLIQSAKFFLQRLELGLAHPSPADECAPPLWLGGGGGEGESQFGREDRHCGTLGNIYVLCEGKDSVLSFKVAPSQFY
jgi:hypothetical protein